MFSRCQMVQVMKYGSVLYPSLVRRFVTPWAYFLHLSLSSVILIDSSTGSPVHFLMLSIQAVRGLPSLRAPGIVPCIISSSRQLPCFLMVWAGFLALTVSSSFLFTPALVRTHSFVFFGESFSVQFSQLYIATGHTSTFSFSQTVQILFILSELICHIVWRNSVGNTIEENSSIFSIIQMCKLCLQWHVLSILHSIKCHQFLLRMLADSYRMAVKRLLWWLVTSPWSWCRVQLLVYVQLWASAVR